MESTQVPIYNGLDKENVVLGMVAHACNPSTLWGRGRKSASTQEAEVAMSQDCAIALQPGQQKRNSISNKQINKKKRKSTKGK